MKPHEKLQAEWAGYDPPYLRAVVHGEGEVAALERRYGILLPPDFREYLLRACSTQDAGMMDQFGHAWWGLDLIRSVAEEYAYPLTNPALSTERDRALLFADYALRCMLWAICCAPGSNYGRIFVISGRDRFVADGFAEFVNQYLADSDKLL